MGIQTNGLRFLLLAKAMGVQFEWTAMIGRQRLQTSFEQAQAVLTSEWNSGIEPATLKSMMRAEYIEELLRYLGADHVHSFDYSEYEGATHVHDFNCRIDPSYYRKYSVVVDGGSLEHVFNFPIAIENCMRMLRVGGHYLGITPTNNYSGHGFYQFSPDLYFRIFSPDNGFRIEHVWLVQGAENRRWFRVADPQIVKRRFRLEDSKRSLLHVLATKIADCEPFTDSPIQSDYVSVWDTVASQRPGAATRARRRRRLERSLPALVPAEMVEWYETTWSRLIRQRKRWKKFLSPFDPTRGSASINALSEAHDVLKEND